VTTQKDRVRLPKDFPVEELPVSMRFEPAAALRDFLGTVPAR
jgi:hypothetical protein